MQPTFMLPPTSQTQGNSFINFQNGVPNQNQQGSSISNQFAHIDLNSGSTSPGSNLQTSESQSPGNFTPVSLMSQPQSFGSPPPAQDMFATKPLSTAGVNFMASAVSSVNSTPVSFPPAGLELQSPRGLNGYSSPSSTLRGPSGLSNEPLKSFSSPQPNSANPASGFGNTHENGPPMTSSFSEPSTSRPLTNASTPVGTQSMGGYSNPQSPLGRPNMTGPGQFPNRPPSNLGGRISSGDPNNESSSINSRGPLTRPEADGLASLTQQPQSLARPPASLTPQPQAFTSSKSDTFHSKPPNTASSNSFRDGSLPPNSVNSFRDGAPPPTSVNSYPMSLPTNIGLQSPPLSSTLRSPSGLSNEPPRSLSSSHSNPASTEFGGSQTNEPPSSSRFGTPPVSGPTSNFVGPQTGTQSNLGYSNLQSPLEKLSISGPTTNLGSSITENKPSGGPTGFGECMPVTSSSNFGSPSSGLQSGNSGSINVPHSNSGGLSSGFGGSTSGPTNSLANPLTTNLTDPPSSGYPNSIPTLNEVSPISDFGGSIHGPPNSLAAAPPLNSPPLGASSFGASISGPPNSLVCPPAMGNPVNSLAMGPSAAAPGGRPNLSRPQYARPSQPTSASSQHQVVPSQPGFPPQQQSGYPSQQNAGFPSSQQNAGFSPSQQNAGFSPSQQNAGVAPSQQNVGFPPSQQNVGFTPSQSAFPPQQKPGFPPSQQNPGFPPPQLNAGFPPSQQNTALPPSQQNTGFPPSQQNAGFPPSQQKLGFPPTQQTAGFLSSQQNVGFPPSQQNVGFPPSQQNVGFPPSQQNVGFPPSQQNVGFPPSQQNVGFPTTHQNSGVPPSQQNSGFPPSQQNSGFTPSQHGSQGAFPPIPQGGKYPGLQSSPGYPPQPNRPGYPPQAQPGYPQGPGGYDQQPQEYSGMQYPNTRPQPPPQKKLDPDNMPSRIQVMEDDRKTRSGEFRTDQRGGLPPLVTTPFTVQDQGNCSPRFVRATMYSVPVTSDLMKQVSVPLGLVVSPLARVSEGELEPPEADFSQSGGPVRCGRCKAYMAPFMQFVDGGRRFHCPMCKATTEVPENYFAHMDAMGQRMDKYQRPELCLGSYEFIVSEQYCRDSKFPHPPALIFLLDVSYNNVKSGLVSLLCEKMMEILGEVTNERARVGFITYASSVQFYNIKSSLVKPELLEVTDVHDMFMPLLDGFLGTVEEAAVAIQSLMGQIPALFQETKQVETLLLPAIQAGLEALKANDTTGKLLVFNSSLPIFDAPGKLANRDDRKMLGTDKEKTVLIPQNTLYNNLAQECVNSGVSVDLFIFNNAYVDLATIGQVSRLTGGQIYKYTYFQAPVDGDRLIEDVKRNITRPTAYDAVMRVRTSTGIRPTDFYGHMFMSNTTDMELASMDCDKAVALELKHDDKLVPEEGVVIQVAFLYTSSYGVRKVRVHNLSLNCTTQMADIYRYCELDTLMNFMSKQCATKLCDTTPRALRDALVTKTASILATYRKHCASPGSSLGQLILPECLKLLPLYVNSLLRCDALSGGPEISLDDRSFALYSSIVMDIPSSVVYLYPHLICLTDLEPDSDEIPSQERASFEKLRPDGVYLLDNSIYMFLWVGHQVSPQWVESVFGVPSPAHIDTEQPRLPELSNPISRRVHDVIDYVRVGRPRSMRLTIVRQKDKLEMVLRQFLIEDRGYTDTQMSYVDFLCHIHKEIRNQLS